MYVLKFKVIITTFGNSIEKDKTYELKNAITDEDAIKQAKEYINSLNYSSFPELYSYEYDRLEIKPIDLVKTRSISVNDLHSKHILTTR